MFKSALYIGAAALCASAAAVKPTTAQLQWQQAEIGVMISYDMITQNVGLSNPQEYCYQAGGDDGEPVPSPAMFNATTLNVTSWVQATKALGAKYIVYVAFHCSGFAQWPSKVYNYTIAQSPLGPRDLIAEFMAACKANDIGAGLYIGWNYNYAYRRGPSGQEPGTPAPGQILIPDAQYEALRLAYFEEVYSRPDVAGQLMEAWIDGGENDPTVNNILTTYQPQAVYIQGSAPMNNAGLVGYESGFPAYPVWSTADCPGCTNAPGASQWIPNESDTPMLSNDAWFWKPSGQSVRPLAELQAAYVASVGANTNWLLGVMPDNTGDVPQDQMDTLTALGQWIDRCFSPSVAVQGTVSTTATSITVTYPDGSWPVIDRVVVREDISNGQAVLAYDVLIQPHGGWKTEWVTVGTGSSIGNKRIQYLTTGPLPVAALMINATSLINGYNNVSWAFMGGYAPCE